MYQELYELDYRKEQFQQKVPGLPAEFKCFSLKIPYTFHNRFSQLLMALADQLIKTGTAIRNTQVQLNKQETYKY
jgi:hypothetical protein